MHGTTNIKFIDVKQASDTYRYKNTKRKLYKTNAAIWYNKVCRQKQLIPTYINISTNGTNKQCQRTHKARLYATCNLLIPEVADTDIVLLMMGGIVTRNM